MGSEVSQKIRSAIKAKLVELGTYVDEELPDYIMVLVANNKTKDQMDDDLSLFLGHNTEPFTSWLHHVLQKLNAASMLKPPPEEPKKKEDKKKAAAVEKPVDKEEKETGRKTRTTRTAATPATKQKPEKEKKEKKGKKVENKSESPLPAEVLEAPKDGKKIKEKEKEKEKAKPGPTLDRSKRNRLPTPPIEEVKEKEKSPPVEKKSVRGRRGTSKVSSAEIFSAETSTVDDQVQEEEQVADDVVEFTADMDELDLELEEEPAPKKLKTAKDGVKEHRKSKEAKIKSKSSTRKSARDTIESEKDNVKEKAPVKEKVSVLDRLGASVTGTESGRRLINLREESSFPPKPSKDAPGMARAVSSAITMAVSSTSGKRHDSRGRSTSRESRSSAIQDDRRTSSGRRVVSTVGAVLSRLSASKDEEDEDDEEEYDPKKPQLSGLASKVEVAPRPKRPGSIQANTALILRAMADAHKSTNRSHRHRIERGPERDESPPPPPKKQKGEIFTKSYREREQSRHNRDIRSDDDEIRVRKIAITVPNSNISKNDFKSSSIVKHETKRSVEKEKTHELVKSINVSKTLTDEEREEQELLQAVVNSRKSRTPGHYKVSEDILVVEEEEEEEEIIDEPMEDELPSLPAPKSITVSNYAHNNTGKTSGERTRFIVTLEGVDQADYRSNERVDLRSRLGPIPSRQLVEPDNMEEVEEYIEEVEEWEEEEMEDEMLCNSDAVTGGTTLQSRLKVPAPVTTAPLPATKLERCRYWPSCSQGESCVYHHPTKHCNKGPACTFGDKCLFIHPNCKFDGSCTRKDCPFTHASTRHIPPTVAKPASSVHYSSKSTTGKIPCRFFPKCTNMNCPFLHPLMCKFGGACKNQRFCTYSHPQVSTGAKLKWIAPKTATATTTATSTTTVKSTITAKT